MEGNVHPNYIKASNLMLGSVVLGIVNMFLVPDTFTEGRKIVTAIFTLLILALIGYAIRLGKNWTKFLLLILMLFGLLAMPFIISNFKSNVLLGVINLTQTALQLSALILLFKVPKQRPNNI